jgi:hypothetical protein
MFISHEVCLQFDRRKHRDILLRNKSQLAFTCINHTCGFLYFSIEDCLLVYGNGLCRPGCVGKKSNASEVALRAHRFA